MTTQRSDAWLTIDDVCKRLNKPRVFVTALLNSGLLGIWDGSGVEEEAVRNFEQFGTQWRKSLGARSLGDVIERIGESYTNIRPPLTHGNGKIARSKAQREQIDVAWIAQYYLIPNEFFFVPPGSMILSGSAGLSLDRIKMIDTFDHPVFLCPDPEHQLAMIMVWSDPKTANSMDQAARVSAEIVTKVIDQISFKYDKALHVAHTLFVGIPSGIIRFEFFGYSPRQAADDFEYESVHPRGIEHAKHLYREALSSPNVFNKFLCLWKSFEVATACRNDVRVMLRGNRRDSRSDVVVENEIVPNDFAFVPFGGLPFNTVKDAHRDTFRNAIAHVSLEDGGARFSDDVKDHYDVWHALPVFCFMSRVRILNALATWQANTSS